MSNQLAVLDAMPSAPDFYGTYWNQRPFVVTGAIPKHDFDDFITADELAGLSMEDSVQSRMVKTSGATDDWSCHFGPFDEQDFRGTGDADWSLLVQNVEQFHPDTARLLRHFNFAPRWLMDDIMVSYSATGGSVGPHIDSYHVFLVQGHGKRRWKIARQPIIREVLSNNQDLKILDGGFDGDEIEVTVGDVLYVPPKFGHEGTTLEDAMTFSVGFLGPKTSELLGSYAQYLSEREEIDSRYVGDGLDTGSTGFEIGRASVDAVRDGLARQLNSDDFTRWLVGFFAEPSHPDFADEDERDQPLGIDDLKAELENGAALHKPEFVKFALTASATGEYCLGYGGVSLVLDEDLMPVVRTLTQEKSVDLKNTPGLLDRPDTLTFLLALYNHQALEITKGHPNP